ncbi:MAG: hypothetical protein AAB074_04010 [Planctomycetota bacterium]
MKHLLLVLLSIVVLASCGKGDSSSGAPAPSGGKSSTGTEGSGSSASSAGAATPQEAFDKAKAAGEKKDYGGLYDIVCPDETDMLVFAAMMIGAFSTMGDEAKAKEFEAISKKYNLPDAKDGPKVDMNDKAAMKRGLAEIFKDVKDKRGFFVEVFTWEAKTAKPGSEAKLNITGTLKDMKETGDAATATMVEADQKEKPMAFKKYQGRWYMSMPGQ